MIDDANVQKILVEKLRAGEGDLSILRENGKISASFNCVIDEEATENESENKNPLQD